MPYITNIYKMHNIKILPCGNSNHIFWQGEMSQVTKYPNQEHLINAIHLRTPLPKSGIQFTDQPQEEFKQLA